MNAATDTLSPRAPVAAPHSTDKFKLLLKREFWEHKGGFFWAPLVAGGIALLFAVLGSIVASAMGKPHGNEVTGVHDPQKMAEVLGAIGDLSFLSGFGIAAVVLGFVAFFYCLGSLYDDRKDRSVLFWKSLPVSDTATVASKVTWALLLAPLLAVAIGVVIGLGLWLVGVVTTTINGVSGASGILTHSHPLVLTANLVALVPIYALWALPTVGWLMLCSAAAPSKPFLWAVMVPVLGCAMVSLVHAMGMVHLDLGGLWYTVAYRGLLSVFAGSWLAGDERDIGALEGPQDLPGLLEKSAGLELLGSTDLWIGAMAGIAMLAIAIRLRRWRDEG